MNTLKSTCARTRALTGAAVAALLLLAAPAAAQDVTPPAPDTMGLLAQDTARTHVVRPGDTLWDLAQHYYGDPFLWPRIHRANTGLVANPHLILPSWRLTIPGLAPERVAGLLGVERELGTPLPPPLRDPDVDLGEPQERVDRTVFFPVATAPTFLREEEITRAVVQPGEHYAAPWLTEGAPLPVLGEVVDLLGREPPGQVLVKSALPHDRLYLRYGPGPRPSIGQRLLMVRPLQEVRGWGRVVQPRGIVQILSLDAEVMTAELVAQFEEVAVGDLAIPVEPAPDLAGLTTQQLVGGPEGALIEFAVPQPLIGDHDEGFIDFGRNRGVGVGDELVVLLPRRTAAGASVELPAEVVARLRVMRVGERTATVKVVHLSQPVLEPGLPVRLVGQVR